MRLLTFIGNDAASGGETLIRHTAPIDLRYWNHPVIEIGGDHINGELVVSVELGVDYKMMAAQLIYTIVLDRGAPIPHMRQVDTSILHDLYPLMPYMRLRVETERGLEQSYVAVLSDKDDA